jgi:hypothetical protein
MGGKMMGCEKCRNSKPVDKEQLVQDLIDYLDYIGVTKESMIATLIDMQESSKYLTPLSVPFVKDKE